MPVALHFKSKKPEFELREDTLPQRLRLRRRQLGLLQVEAAASMGVSEFTYIHWETGQTRPGLRHQPAIAEFLAGLSPQ